MRTGIAVDDFRFACVQPTLPGTAKRLLERDVIGHQIGSDFRETCFGIQEVALGVQHIDETLASSLKLREREFSDLAAVADDRLQLRGAQMVLIECDACILHFTERRQNCFSIGNQGQVAACPCAIDFGVQLAALKDRNR